MNLQFLLLSVLHAGSTQHCFGECTVVSEQKRAGTCKDILPWGEEVYVSHSVSQKPCQESFGTSPRPYIAKKLLTLSLSGVQTKIRKMIDELKGSTCKSRTAGVLSFKSY